MSNIFKQNKHSISAYSTDLKGKMLALTGNASFNGTKADACGHSKSDLFKTKYVFAIDNFSFREMSSTHPIQSPVFILDLPDQKVELMLEIYTQGFLRPHYSCLDHVMEWVEVIKCDGYLNASVELGIINRNGREKELFRDTRIVTARDRFGLHKFIARSDLYDMNSELCISSDRLIVYCVFSVVLNRATVSYNNLKVSFAKPTFDDFNKKLFESKKFWDLSLLVNEETVKAHKSILAAKSPFFAGLLTDEMTEIEIDDLSYAALMEMLRYIYTGQMENIDIIKELLLASIKYQMEDLKAVCHENIISKIDLANAIDFLTFANDNRSFMNYKLLPHFSSRSITRLSRRRQMGLKCWVEHIFDLS